MFIYTYDCRRKRTWSILSPTRHLLFTDCLYFFKRGTFRVSRLSKAMFMTFHLVRVVIVGRVHVYCSLLSDDTSWSPFKCKRYTGKFVLVMFNKILRLRQLSQ